MRWMLTLSLVSLSFFPAAAQAQYAGGIGNLGTGTSGAGSGFGGGQAMSQQAGSLGATSSGLGAGSTSSGTFGNRTIGSSVSQGRRTFGQATTSTAPNTQFQRGTRRNGSIVGTGGSIGSFIGADQITGQRGNNNQGAITNNNSRNNRNDDPFSSRDDAGSKRSQALAKIRPQLKLGFDPPLPTPPQATATLSKHLTRLPGVVGTVQVELVGTTAVLTGTVQTEHARAAIGQVALLEPGVQRIENLLELQQ